MRVSLKSRFRGDGARHYVGPAEVTSKLKLAQVNCEYQEAGDKETGGLGA